MFAVDNGSIRQIRFIVYHICIGDIHLEDRILLLKRMFLESKSKDVSFEKNVHFIKKYVILIIICAPWRITGT